MRRSLILILVLFIVLPVLGRAEEDHYKAMRAIKFKKRVDAPEFTLSFLTRDGDLKKRSIKDFRGKVILLNFWASWCPPCRKEMPSIERLYRAFKDRGFVVIGVNYMEEADTVKDFMKDFDLTFPSFLDEGGSVAEMYRVMGIPTTFLIDREGRIAAKVLGDREWDSDHAKAIVEELLKE